MSEFPYLRLNNVCTITHIVYPSIKTSLWTWTCKYLLEFAFSSFGHVPQSGIAGSYSNSMFNFEGYLNTVFHSGQICFPRLFPPWFDKEMNGSRMFMRGPVRRSPQEPRSEMAVAWMMVLVIFETEEDGYERYSNAIDKTLGGMHIYHLGIRMPYVRQHVRHHDPCVIIK